MKKSIALFLSFAFVVSMAGVSGSAFAADQGQEAYSEFNQTVLPLRQQMYAKQAELRALRVSPQPDTAKAQQLYGEIADLKSQMFQAQTELRNKYGEAGIACPGMGVNRAGWNQQGGPAYSGRGNGNYGGGMGYGGGRVHHGGRGHHGGGRHGGWGW